MKKIKLLIELIKTSTKAKIITSVVTVSILGGGTAAGIIAYNNYQEGLTDYDKGIVVGYHEDDIEGAVVVDEDDKRSDTATKDAVDKLKEEILELDPNADVTVDKEDLGENINYYKDLKEKLSEKKNDTKPSDENKSDNKDIVSKPVENKPVESKPVESKPVESKPVESKPIETKPVESKPVETKPVETKPVETKPVETKPAQPQYQEYQGISYNMSADGRTGGYIGSTSDYVSMYPGVSSLSTVSEFNYETNKITQLLTQGAKLDIIKSRIVGKKYSNYLIKDVIVTNYSVPILMNGQLVVDPYSILLEKGVTNVGYSYFSSVLGKYGLASDSVNDYFMRVVVVFEAL